MTVSEWSQLEAEYGRKILESGLEGARSGREAFLDGKPLTPVLSVSLRNGLKPAAHWRICWPADWLYRKQTQVHRQILGLRIVGRRHRHLAQVCFGRIADWRRASHPAL